MVHPTPWGEPQILNLELLYPDADTETSGWSSTPLHDKVDETTPTDNTEVGTTIPHLTDCSPDAPSSTTFDSDDNFTVSFPDWTLTPSGDEVLKYRVRAAYEVDAGVGQMEMDMELLQGASTVIASRTGIVLTTGFLTYVDTVSGTEKGNITDWDDLRVRVTVRGCHNDFGETDGRVSQIQLETE